MIVALWIRWRSERRVRLLVLVAVLVAADLLVGPVLIAWEIHVVREMIRQ